MALLEDLGAPGHADGDGGAEAESDHEEAAVAGPAVVGGQGGGQETGDLDADGGGEEVRARSVEAVGDGSDYQNGDEIHDPDGGGEQADLDAGGLGLDGRNDDGAVELGSDTDTNNSKVHQSQGPQTPVAKNFAEILKGPRASVVDTSEIVVMDNSILPLEDFGGLGEPLEESGVGSFLAGSQRTIREPPEKNEAQDNSHETIEEEHPAESNETTIAIHELEACGDEADNGSRDLRSSEVVTNSLGTSRGRVEQGKIVRHARPHSRNDQSEKESEELETPGIVDGSEASADQRGRKDDAGHPETGAELAHDQVGGEVEDDIGDVKQRESSRDVLGFQVEDVDEVMLLVLVHGLGDSDVGPDGGAEEIENPECWEWLVF